MAKPMWGLQEVWQSSRSLTTTNPSKSPDSILETNPVICEGLAITDKKEKKLKFFLKKRCFATPALITESAGAFQETFIIITVMMLNTVVWTIRHNVEFDSDTPSFSEAGQETPYFDISGIGDLSSSCILHSGRRACFLTPMSERGMEVNNFQLMLSHSCCVRNCSIKRVSTQLELST